MKKGVTLILDDQELIELWRILMDEDAPAALDFLKARFKGKVRELLEGAGSRILEFFQQSHLICLVPISSH